MSEGEIKPVIFLTHISPLVRKLFKQKKYDFGLHSNFKKLLNGDDGNRKYSANELRRLMTQFLGIDVVRSHSLTISLFLKVLFRDKNFFIKSSFITHETCAKFKNFWTEFN